ncbi:hypothetical protein [Ochrobactrum quorumnocens]|uniref:hypothetical protein n=1 Tax=Ochrobactrum quorumnocens TaxID=271865 RepID=UPI0012441AA8|nr:hypothetical protein [[Ochrobactrum] quorumnocens]
MMNIAYSASPHTLNSLRAIITRQMVEVLLEHDAVLGDLDACRQVLTRANFGRPAIEALLETTCGEATREFISNYQAV